MMFPTFVKKMQILLLPILIALVVLPNSAAADWEVTQYLAVGPVQSLKAYTDYSISTEAGVRVTVYTTSTYTFSYTTTLILTASPTSPSVAPTRTSTSTDTYDHVIYTKYYVPLASFPDPAALPTQADYYNYLYGETSGTDIRTKTIWLEERTSTASSFCTKQWTYTDASTVYPPTAVYPQLKPTSTSDSTYATSTTSRLYLTRPDGVREYVTTVLPRTTVIAYKYLSPDTIPTSTYSKLDMKSWYSSAFGDVEGASRYTSYICSNPSPYQTTRPTSTSTSGSRSSYRGSSDLPSSDKTGDERTDEIVEWLKNSGGYDYYTDDQLRKIAEQMQYPSWAAWMWSRKEVKAGVIAAVVIVAVLFLGGFMESFVWFGRLMTGKSALRGGTICWAIMTVWAACLIKREKAVQDEDRRTGMALKWKEMGMSQKLGLWSKYGMKWRYPVDVLGPRECAGTGGKNIPVVTVTEVDQVPVLANTGRGDAPMASMPEEQTVAPTAPAPVVPPAGPSETPGNTTSATSPPAAGNTPTA